MNPEDRAAAAFQRLEHAMDTANDLIGELIRRLDDGRPRLRVVGGGATETGSSGDVSPPRLRIVEPPPPR
jgi:hypothetical protein